MNTMCTYAFAVACVKGAQTSGAHWLIAHVFEQCSCGNEMLNLLLLSVFTIFVRNISPGGFTTAVSMVVSTCMAKNADTFQKPYLYVVLSASVSPFCMPYSSGLHMAVKNRAGLTIPQMIKKGLPITILTIVSSVVTARLWLHELRTESEQQQQQLQQQQTLFHPTEPTLHEQNPSLVEKLAAVGPYDFVDEEGLRDNQGGDHAREA